ncbi:hypothetical protein [Paludisphaera rhizosphaerae]|uniref:hypothetical protein n=1 Tax=Paludisphaera rhizosphaerae TaxID=2711216 RepID=UPI0013EE17A4|nr:hypothetical protein [Paludisphaera rhizosphaerae]
MTDQSAPTPGTSSTRRIDSSGTHRVCIHLFEKSADDYIVAFTGKGTEYRLVCTACRDESSRLVDVTAEQFARIEADCYWETGRAGIVGRPAIRERFTGATFAHVATWRIDDMPGGVEAVGVISMSAEGEFILLSSEDLVYRINPRRCETSRLTALPDWPSTTRQSLAVHVSPRGEWAAIVERRGQFGVVLDLIDRRTTMRLDRGDYYPEQSDFPVAFFEHDGEPRLVHATDWNRLDVSDPRDGRLLTERAPTSYARGEPCPVHYLNYFHGRLTMSPDGRRIAEDGWVWHPAGVVAAWSLDRWLHENPWESEDGSSRRNLTHRVYFWGGPLCWIDDRTLAVWGFGNDDENLIPAALLFDAETGDRIGWFPGPIGEFAFDRFLFSFTAEHGTSAWDVSTGERVAHDPGFSPTVYHPGIGGFLTIRADGEIDVHRLAVD